MRKALRVSPLWTQSQLDRRATVEAGGTVLANMHKGVDSALLDWAAAAGKLQRIDRRSVWGNPRVLARGGDRLEVIASYMAFLEGEPELRGHLEELRGRVLYCWCHPLPCHGDVLIEALAALDA